MAIIPAFRQNIARRQNPDGKVRALLAGLGLALLAGACTYGGGGDDPAVRKLSWFDFIDGGDIKRACTAESRDRLRLTYNQDYRVHVRVYEIAVDATGGATLTAMPILGRPGPTFSLSSAGFDWASRRYPSLLKPAAWQDLKQILAADHAFGPGKDGLRVDAFETFWTVAGCIDGKPAFQVFRYGDEDFAALRFPERVFKEDKSGVPVEPPRQKFDTTPADAAAGDGRYEPSFTLQSGPTGFLGIARIL